MNKLLILFLILNVDVAFGHQDFYVVKDFENVKVRIKTGFQYEEIEKGCIIGELAKRLCQELRYTKPVLIDFDHYYTGNCEPDYFLSYDRGSIAYKWDNEKPKPFLKDNSLIIREVSRKFMPSVTLKLLEYSILNVEKIRASQKQIEYNQNYCQWKINTIDTLEVKRVVEDHVSDYVAKVLSTKVYVKKVEDGPRNTYISYFFQAEKYHIFYTDYSDDEYVLLVVDNVYQFTKTSFDKSIVFDTDSSFYFVQGRNYPWVSKRNVIENTNGYYRPFEISKIGSHKIALSFEYYPKTGRISYKERNVLYKSDSDELVQDLDVLLKKD